MPLLPSLPNPFTWRMLALFGLGTAILGLSQGFTVHPRSLTVAAIILTVMLVIAHVYTYWRPRPQFAYPAILVAFMVVNGVVFGPMSYFVAGLGMPLTDATLAAFDPLVGFDWRAMQHFTASNEPLARIAGLIYHTSGFQIFMVWCVLGFTGQFERLGVFLTAMVAATGVCLVLAGLFPAAGAYTYFTVPPSEMGYLAGTEAGVWHMKHLTALRDGSMRMINLSQLEGIVTFPSFHTVVALLCGWAMYRTRYVGIPATIHSGIIVLTVLPFGGHYLIDVVVGVAITVASVALGLWAERNARAKAATAPAAPEHGTVHA